MTIPTKSKQNALEGLQKLDFGDKRGSGGIRRNLDEKSSKMHERVVTFNKTYVCKMDGRCRKMERLRVVNLQNR